MFSCVLEADEPNPAKPLPIPRVYLCFGQRCGDEILEWDGCWW